MSTKFIVWFHTISRLENHLSEWQGLGIYSQSLVVIQGPTGRPTGTGRLYLVIHVHPGTMDEAPGDQEAAPIDSHPTTCSHIRSLSKPMGDGSWFLLTQSHLITHFWGLQTLRICTQGPAVIQKPLMRLLGAESLCPITVTQEPSVRSTGTRRPTSATMQPKEPSLKGIKCLHPVTYNHWQPSVRSTAR